MPTSSAPTSLYPNGEEQMYPKLNIINKTTCYVKSIPFMRKHLLPDMHEKAIVIDMLLLKLPLKRRPDPEFERPP